MALGRALTTRRKAAKDEAPPAMPYVGPAASQRSANAKPIKRAEISLPVALISTTNMLSYEAPDITNAPHAQRMGGRYMSSTSSVMSSTPSVSGDDSDIAGSVHSRETDATSLDLSSPELSQDPYHKQDYFKATSSPLSQRSTELSSKPSLDFASPRIPVRAASHSKKAHVMSHKASVRRMNTTAARPTSREKRESEQSTASSIAPIEPLRPFARELAQLNEAIEENGLVAKTAPRGAEAEADYNIMQAHGLGRFCAADYADEIASLTTVFEEDHATYQPMVWI